MTQTPCMSARACTAAIPHLFRRRSAAATTWARRRSTSSCRSTPIYDRRTAYTFGVSASGVRLDRYHPRDDESSADAGFDPVWEARTAIDEQGWTAELWIPFAQLRFIDRPDQVWGLNIARFTPTLDEEDYWVVVPRTQTAWASRFGALEGIAGRSAEPAYRVVAGCGRIGRVQRESRPEQSFRRAVKMAWAAWAPISRWGSGPVSRSKPRSTPISARWKRIPQRSI